jgi:hypothetical protein
LAICQLLLLKAICTSSTRQAMRGFGMMALVHLKTLVLSLVLQVHKEKLALKAL